MVAAGCAVVAGWTHAHSKVSWPLSFGMHFVDRKFLGHSFLMGLSRSAEEKVGALLSVKLRHILDLTAEEDCNQRK